MSASPLQSHLNPHYALAKARLLTQWWGGDILAWVYDADRLTAARLDRAEAERAICLSRPLGADRVAR